MSIKTIAFLGASAGCGLSALRRSLAAGATCTALCRNPSKLTSALNQSTSAPEPGPSNLTIIEGNAHDIDAVSRTLAHPADSTALVDLIVFSIGGAFDFTRMTIDDPHVCEQGMKTLLAALNNLRNEGRQGRPHIVVVSTTGISRFGRDIPLAMVPMYKFMLRVPHEDKKKMEEMLRGSGEEWTAVRPSLLTDGGEEGVVRVGVEGGNGVERKEVGYSISREAVGKWIFEEVVQKGGEEFVGKAVGVTF